MSEIEIKFPFDTSVGSNYYLFRDMNNGIEPITYNGEDYLIGNFTIDANAECTATLYPYPGSTVGGSDLPYDEDWSDLANELCIYCGQEYREVEHRWRDGTRAGCSCCGAPKG